MVRGQGISNEVVEYVKTLRPITDFSTLTEGQKIFNKYSLDVSYEDTFVSYDEEHDIIEYRNYKGQLWCGGGKDFWYYLDEKKEASNSENEDMPESWTEIFK